MSLQKSTGAGMLIEETKGGGILSKENRGAEIPVKENRGAGMSTKENREAGIPINENRGGDGGGILTNETRGTGIPTKENRGGGVLTKENRGAGIQTKENRVGGIPAKETRGGGIATNEPRVAGIPTRENRVGGIPTKENRRRGMPTKETRGTGIPTKENRIGGIPTKENRIGGIPTKENRVGGISTKENRVREIPMKRNKVGGIPTTENRGEGLPTKETRGERIPTKETRGGGGKIPAEETRKTGIATKENRVGGIPIKENRVGGIPTKDSRGTGIPTKENRVGGITRNENRGGGIPTKQSKVGGILTKENRGRGIPTKETRGRGIPTKEAREGGIPTKEARGGEIPTKESRGGGISTKENRGGMPTKEIRSTGILTKDNRVGGISTKETRRAGIKTKENREKGIPTRKIEKQESQERKPEERISQQRKTEEKECQQMKAEEQKPQQGVMKEQECRKGKLQKMMMEMQTNASPATELKVACQSGVNNTGSNNGEEFYQKMPSHADTKGQNFEIKMAILLFLRALNSGQRFFLASNVAGVGQFDDLVFGYTDREQHICRIFFVQLKHKQRAVIPETNISRDFISLKGDFSMPQYCRSYPEVMNWLSNCKVCDTGSCVELVLFTNKTLRTNTKCSGDAMLLTGGQVFGFTEHNDADVYDLFQQLQKCSHLLQESDTDSLARRTEEIMSGIQNVDIRKKLQELKSNSTKLTKELKDWRDMTYYKDFMEKIRIYSSQSDESGLDKFIKEEMKQACGVCDSDVGILFEELLKEMHRWWEKECFYLTENSEFWKKRMNSRIHYLNEAKLKHFTVLGISFNKEETTKLRNLIFCNSVVHVVPIECTGTVLSSMKVHQCLEGENHLLLDVSTVQTHLCEVIALWSKWCDLLIVEGNSIKNMDPLADIFNKFSNKRLIFVAHSVAWKTIKCVRFHDHIEFEQFDEPSQSKLMERLNGHFQTFWTLPFEAKVSVNKNLITANTILQLLTEEFLSGDYLTEESEYYVPRILQLGCPKSSCK